MGGDSPVRCRCHCLNVHQNKACAKEGKLTVNVVFIGIPLFPNNRQLMVNEHESLQLCVEETHRTIGHQTFIDHKDRKKPLQGDRVGGGVRVVV